MPLQDTASLVGGFGQNIADWQNGDDRIFTGTLASVLPASDPSFTDGYFTLKLNPNDTDANALIQKHVTQVSSAAGAITASAGNFVVFLIHVYSGDYEGLVNVGTSYWWDFRAISTNGITVTLATGQVVFQQNVTQVNKAGTLAVLSNSGQPQFRGFISQTPQGYATGTFNPGDFYFNSNPINGLGVGWQCTGQGDINHSVWVAFGLSTGALLADTHFKGYIAAPPTVGTYVALDWYFNSGQVSGEPEGWVCTVGGTPGTWRTKGVVGDTDGS